MSADNDFFDGFFPFVIGLVGGVTLGSTIIVGCLQSHEPCLIEVARLHATATAAAEAVQTAEARR